MRQSYMETRLNHQARAFSGKFGSGFHMAALYSALAVIAAVVFGSLSVHPF